MQGTREVIAATVFIPVAFPQAVPPANAYMRNCSGVGNAQAPDHVAAGHFRVFVPQDLDPLHTSITARAVQSVVPPALPLALDVVVVLTKIAPNQTQVDVLVYDNANALTDAASTVEVSLARLPL